MCCCCPDAIQALFCLWVQSGCSKGSVAGALTFFPPEPALYKMERHDRHGNLLTTEQEEALLYDSALDEDVHELHDNRQDEEEEDFGDEEALMTGTRSDAHLEEEDDEFGDATEMPATPEPLEEGVIVTSGSSKKAKRAASRKNKPKKEKSPAQQVVERNQALRRRAKRRNQRDAQDLKEGVTYTFRLDPRLSAPPVRGGIVEALKLPSKRGTHLATLVYKVPESHVTPTTKTLIYSHGNATDIGAMYGLQAILVHSLDCHVVCYDYSGYGASGGVPMERHTYQDIETVYNYVKEHISSESNIVLYGQSVGSGPSCYLCAQPSQNPGGLILHSPFTSGMRVLTPSRALACLDIYPNINRIRKVTCPTFVIHGVLDEEVSVSHGRAMYAATPHHLQREPWWVPDRGHNDITEGPGKMAEYIRRLRRFLSELDE